MSSLRDVAHLAGVSLSTVSRVINSSAFVKPQTARRVEEAIKKLNYKPNLMASGLKSKSSRLIGVVIPTLSLPTFVSLIQNVSEYCHKFDYEVVLGQHHDNPEEELKIVDGFVRRNVDGLLLSLACDESRVLDFLHSSDVTTVIFDRAIKDSPLNSVVLNNHLAGRLAGDHLAGLGHKRIACISGPTSVRLSRERLKGFVDALTDNGIDLSQRNVEEGDFGYEAGYHRAFEIFANADENYPTAVWAQNDMMALGVIRCLHELGLKVPRDVSVMGMDNNFLTEITSPKLTTIEQPLCKMAEQAFDFFRTAKTMPHRQKVFTFEPKLIVRESTMPPANA